MAKNHEVTVRINAKDDSSSVVRGIESSFASLGRTLTTPALAFGALAAASAAAVGAIKVGVDAANEQEDALKKLDSALQLKGLEKFSQALRDQADALQLTTRFGDDAINSAQALIATYGVAGPQLKLATQASVDLAARLGIDLNSAAIKVASTINGVTRGVDRVVPALKGLSAESLRSGEGIRILAEAMAGGAVDAADTFSGRMEILGNKTGEIIEKFGEAAKKSIVLSGAMSGLESVVGAVATAVGVAATEVNLFATAEDGLNAAMQETIDALAQSTVDYQAHTAAVERAARINVDLGNAISTAAGIANEFGITLESTVNAQLDANSNKLKSTHEDFRIGAITLADYNASVLALAAQEAELRAKLNGTTEALGRQADALNSAAQAADNYARAMIPVNAGGLTLSQQITFAGGGGSIVSGTQIVNGGRFGDTNLNGTPRRF
jgi:hypothetical protein